MKFIPSFNSLSTCTANFVTVVAVETLIVGWFYGV